MKRHILFLGILLLLATAYVSAQNVGIGTQSPTGLLHIASNDTADELHIGEPFWNIKDAAVRVNMGSSLSSALIRMGQSAENFMILGWVTRSTVANAFAKLGTHNGTNALLLQDLGGNVGIGPGFGSNSSSTILPSDQLHVKSTSAFITRLESNATIGTWLTLQNTSTGGKDWSLISTGSNNGEGVGNLLFRDNGSASVRMMIQSASGNVGIGTIKPDTSAVLDIQDTTKGILIPRLTVAQKNAIASPAKGLIIFQSDSTAGLYYNSGTTTLPVWERMVTSNSAWTINGNNATDPASHFFGTTDDKDLVFKRNNIVAGLLDSINTSWGVSALQSITSGRFNTANGYQALFSNNTGTANTANGAGSLYSNTQGFRNTASGGNALRSNTTGNDNTASGQMALFSNTTGNNNTANGVNALLNNTTGNDNTANGRSALVRNITGNGNTANGIYALHNNHSGNNNTANGYNAMFTNNTGSNNTAIGFSAEVSLDNLTNATAIGAFAEVGASNALVLGSIAGVNFAISSVNVGIGTTAPKTRLHIVGGSDAEANDSLSGYLVSGNVTGTNIIIDDNEIMARDNGGTSPLYLQNDGGLLRTGGAAEKPGGGLWAATSDARLKQNISPYKEGLQQLLQINPVHYQYNNLSGYDVSKKYIGVIAQDMQKIAPYMVTGFNKNDTEYLQVDNSPMLYMLINAVKEQQAQIEILKAMVEQLTKK